MEDGCGYIEKSVANSRHGVVPQLGSLARYQHLLTLKNHVTKYYVELRNLMDYLDEDKDYDVGGPCGMHGRGRKQHAKSEGMRPLDRPGRRWERNTKMDLKEIECECVDCIYLVKDTDQ